MNTSNLDLKVRAANKKFYDAVADIYEKVDGRRTEILKRWLESRLKLLSNATEAKVLLDLGCGSGIVLRNSLKFFKYSYGIDISLEILKKTNCDALICADCSSIPLKDESVDVVVCFSLLHHIYDHTGIFREVYRILRKGGLFYIDHDIDSTFVKRFYSLLKSYRYIFNPAARFMKLTTGITKELYELSEIHSDGIDSNDMIKKLVDLGFFKMEMYYHWFGLNSTLNMIIKHRRFNKGFAPLVCIVVKK